MGELVQVPQWQAPAKTVEALVAQVITAAQLRSGLSPAGVANALNRMSPRHPGVMPGAVVCWKEGVASPDTALFCYLLELAGVDVAGRFKDLLALLGA